MGKRDKKLPDQLIPTSYLKCKIKFSFEFYDSSCKYCLSKWGDKDVLSAIKRLKEINGKTLGELKDSRSTYHFHFVDWKNTQEKNGFPESRANQLEPYQFSLVGINNQKARVYGACAEGVFYIVWFDFEHEIWPSFKKHT